MRKAVFILIFLLTPAFARDDELPRRLTPNEQRQSIKCPPNMRRCIGSSATPIPEGEKGRISGDWQARVKAHGNKPVVIPGEEKQESPTLTQSLRVDGNPIAGVALLVCVGAAIYAVILFAQRKR